MRGLTGDVSPGGFADEVGDCDEKKHGAPVAWVGCPSRRDVSPAQYIDESSPFTPDTHIPVSHAS